MKEGRRMERETDGRSYRKREKRPADVAQFTKPWVSSPNCIR